MGYDGQPTKRKPKSAKNGAASNDAAPFLRKAAEWKGYVNVEQSEQTKEHFLHFSEDKELVVEALAQALASGYKLSVVQVDNDETVKATAYAAFAGMPDSGLSVSAWAETAFQALAAAAYIVVIQAQLDLSRFDLPEERRYKRTF